MLGQRRSHVGSSGLGDSEVAIDAVTDRLPVLAIVEILNSPRLINGDVVDPLDLEIADVSASSLAGMDE